MTPERLQRVNKLFDEALERAAGEREAFLAEACGADAALCREVRSLLEEYRKHFPSAAETQLTAAGGTAERYVIERPLGEGGMGKVYLAKDTRLGRQVAVKFCNATLSDEHLRKRFMREARAASALSHPHVAHIYDYGETRVGQPFLVMEWVRGGTLRGLLKLGLPAVERAVEIVAQAADGLAEAHRRGIVHRDIKPSNIGLNERSEAKVLDFGLAKLAQSPHAEGQAGPLTAEVTRPGVVMGTAEYMSPEQARGQAVDARSDIFSLGAVLYECLAGRAAFCGRTMAETLKLVEEFEPAPPSRSNPRVSRSLDAVVAKAMAKQASDRYATAEEFCDSLRRAARPALWSRVSRRGAAIAAGALAVVSIGWMAAERWLSPAQEWSPQAVRLYQEGIQALHDGTYHKASKALEEAVRMEPGFAAAHARLAEALMELDDGRRAQDALLRATAPGRRGRLARREQLHVEAIHLTVAREFTAALERYRALLKETAPDYLELGRAHERTGEDKKALASYQRAMQLDARNPAVLLRLGQIEARHQNAAGAAEHFRRAEQIYQAASNYEGVTEVMYQRAAMLNRLERSAEARVQLEGALRILGTTGNLHQRLRVQLQLARIRRTAGDLVGAEQQVREALSMARSNGMESLATQAVLDLGNVHLARRDTKAAKDLYLEALKVAEKDQSQAHRARALLSLASVCMQEDDVAAATRYMEAALPFYQRGGYRKEVSQALTMVAQAHLVGGNYAQALRMFEEQWRLAEKADDRGEMTQARLGLGMALAAQQEYPRALAQFSEAQALARASGQATVALYSLVDKAEMLWRLGRYTEAEAALREAEAAPGSRSWRVALVRARMCLSQGRYTEAMKHAAGAQRSDHRNFRVEAEMIAALAEVRAGSAPRAAAGLEKAVEAARALNDKPLLVAALLAMAEMKLALGDHAGASATAAEAVTECERLPQPEAEWRARLLAGQRERARQALAALEAKWGGGPFRTYASRPDVRGLRRQLERGAGSD